VGLKELLSIISVFRVIIFNYSNIELSKRRKYMNLKLVFKIGAVWLGLFGALMLFAGQMTIESFGMEATNDMVNLARWMGLAMLTIAGIHWVIPMWVEDNLNNFGMFSAVAWTAFNLLNVYEFVVGITPTDAANLIPFGIQVIITALFYFYSQKS
jgi:uncharacterized membrane protein|tara:strand:+ start:39 stop:503 length:465 start_codon:yes stop_codon:yes gene_type:complete